MDHAVENIIQKQKEMTWTVSIWFLDTYKCFNTLKKMLKTLRFALCF